ncbi:ATP-binding protein [Burkholderia glumae]|uniref:Oxygen sensor histidine kinase NreB n=1 Tax=Burkholderia glumae TaxID=337 RepID=A0AAP9XWH1_BURGL|nr:ATP-binding protein [Burkholderia glumae]ACR32343.1 Sensory box histidine kinase [Burkholderia glumae BGR1]AJY63048.1 sensory box protein [Burkholderia glumae LMG 2196 = ATCC 33617]MCM2484461.1 PAS domain S-box protein [Burkholderia glumae]MCM2510153.1 PAS domain S-box protein [Burkholderia glumae]MCM2539917.1 PAS domain S-box protein [Burkholderia glumae]
MTPYRLSSFLSRYPRGCDARKRAAVSLLLLAGLAVSFEAATQIHRLVLAAQSSAFEQRTDAIRTSLRQQIQAATAMLLGVRQWTTAHAMLPRPWQSEELDFSDLERAHSPIRQLRYLDAATVFARLALQAAPAAAARRPAWSGQRLRASLQQAIASDQIALAAPWFAADSAAAANGQGNQLELYLPVYRDMSRPDGAIVPAGRPVAGFLSVAIDLSRFMAMANGDLPAVALRVSAGPAAPVRAAGRPGGGDFPRLRRTLSASVAGTALTLDFSAEGRRGARRADAFAALVLLAGSGCTALAGVLLLRLPNHGPAPGPRLPEPLGETRLMGIIRASSEAIITIDESQTVLIFNPAAERIFGVPAADAIGGPLARFLPERCRAAHERHIARFGLAAASPRQMGRQQRLYGLRANGEEFPLEASISQLGDGAGRICTIVLRDVTERVRSDNALEHARDELRAWSAHLQQAGEEEKTRLARELHDDLGQQLAVLEMEASAAAQALDRVLDGARDPGLIETAVNKLHGMRRLTDSAVASVRRVAANLRPLMLDDLGVVPAIEWLASDFAKRHGIEVVRHVALGERTLTGAGATALFRIVQEALVNVAKHAQASRVDICLKAVGDACVLRVADNGRGVPHERPRAGKAFGLIGVRERAHALGGRLTIAGPPGQGFSITVTLPLAVVQQGAPGS